MSQALEDPNGDSAAPQTKTRRADRRHLRGQVSLSRIIDATIALVAEGGLSGATIQSVAKRVGSSNSLMIFHFGTKEQLFRAVLEFLSEQFARHWDTNVKGPMMTMPARVLAAIDCARSFREQHPDWVAALVLFGFDRQTVTLDRDISPPSERAYLEDVRAMLTEIARAGGHKDVDVDSLAGAMNYLVQGACYWDTINKVNPPSDAVRKMGLVLLRQAFPREFSGC